MGRRPSQESHRLQQLRVEEAGRGRSARSPLRIPARGWKDIFWRTYTQIGDDRLLAVAAGAVFYMLLALFPAITALVSLYGLLADPATINDHLLLLQGVMPEAVSRGSDGYLRVYYEKLGLKFRTYSDWLADGARMPAEVSP